MKTILKLTGVQKLSKKEQQDVNGANFSRPYCNGPNRCCVRTPSGIEFCDYGYCVSGRCIWA
ncbi:hypothetical protein [Aquimarina algiphila]|uniref:Bacteriocin n=1 Tax=Aquimarina algiphila TaxID=2047982 RepID=A0A554VKI2_9FLAO|nr:hypothetical protein [Aquimarina algiphila]TSE08511.1 hypothetical protein FOF46_12120 [Aquimarina algiphila]